MDCYILHTTFLVNILLFIIAIICNHYAKHRSKLNKKYICILKIKKWRIMNFKKFLLKIVCVIILMKLLNLKILILIIIHWMKNYMKIF